MTLIGFPEAGHHSQHYRLSLFADSRSDQSPPWGRPAGCRV